MERVLILGPAAPDDGRGRRNAQLAQQLSQSDVPGDDFTASVTPKE